MDGFAHQVVAGIATGGVYASVALALVMIYQATHHVNFAQGEMATLSTFIALSMIQAGLPYWVAFVGTVAVSFAIGVAGATNAGLAAAAILANKRPEIDAALKKFRVEQTEKVLSKPDPSVA